MTAAGGAPRIAIAGAGRSQGDTAFAIAAALRERGAQPVVFDLSSFDRRSAFGSGSGPVRELSPADAGLFALFRSSGTNLLVSGGAFAFSRMKRRWARLLSDEGIAALLLCHYYGYPEQALLMAASENGVGTAQIDEGPFSRAIRPQFEPSVRSSKLLVTRSAVGLKLLPPRDFSGRMTDLFIATSAKRRDSLLAAGIPLDRVMLAPPPRYDALPATARAWRGRRTGRTSRVLFIHQPFMADLKVDSVHAMAAEAVIVNGLAALGRSRPLDVTVRFHPKAGYAERGRLIASLERCLPNVRVSAGGPLEADLLDHHAFVGYYSSALLEAAACGAPVVVSEISPSGFASPSEAFKMAAMATFGVGVERTSERFADELDRRLALGVVEPNNVLFDSEIGPMTGDGAVQAAQALIELTLRRESRLGLRGGR